MQILDWFHEGIAPNPAGRKRFEELQHAVTPQGGRPSRWKLGAAIGICVALIVFGWGLLLAGLLYVASDDAWATWLVTSLLLAAGHVVLAIVCWRYAVTVWRKPQEPGHPDDDRLRR